MTASRADLAHLASDQWGLVTTAQATAAGVSRTLLTRMVSAGELERIVQGVYATPGATSDEHVERRALWLALDPDRTATERLGERHTAGVLSHASAAALHEIGDILDDRVEITLPGRHQTRRQGLRVHRAQLRPGEVTLVDGLPVTTPAPTLADLVLSGHDRDHVATAMADAIRRGATTSSEVHAALTGRITSERAGSIVDELLAAAGLDEASLERAVASSPFGQKAIAEGLAAILRNLAKAQWSGSPPPKMPMLPVPTLVDQVRGLESIPALQHEATPRVNWWGLSVIRSPHELQDRSPGVRPPVLQRLPR